MKRFIKHISLLLCCIALSAEFFVAASAHPGKTDSSGGHYDHSTGEYHYHHGYSAHSHYDVDGDGIVDCPYDFDDQTDHSSGSNNSSISSYQYTYPDIPVYATIPFEKDDVNFTQSKSKNGSAAEIIKQEENMFAEIIGAIFIYIASLFYILPLGFALVCFLAFLSWVIIYPLSGVLFRKKPDKREGFSLISSVSIAIFLSLYWFLMPFAVFLAESTANIIAFVILLIIFVLILMLIIWKSWQSIEETVSERDELNKKNKDLSSSCADLQNKLNQSELRHQSSSEYILRLQRENQQKKNDYLALLKNNSSLQAEIDELKQKIHFFESGHTVSNPQIKDLPSDVYFVNGLPIAGKVTDSEPFGRFTVYASKKGSKFHADEFCGGNFLQPTHLFEAIENKQRCMKCGNSLPDSPPSWYLNYKYR